jgi:hypothetical protein
VTERPRAHVQRPAASPAPARRTPPRSRSDRRPRRRSSPRRTRAAAQRGRLRRAAREDHVREHLADVPLGRPVGHEDPQHR